MESEHSQTEKPKPRVIEADYDGELALRIYLSALDFNYAWGVMHQHSILRLRTPGNTTVPCGIPNAIVSSLCIELYLKSLLAIYEIGPIEKHPLRMLFNHLPRTAIDEITLDYQIASESDTVRFPPNDECGNPFPTGYHKLSTTMKRLSEAFVEWRYVFEKKKQLDFFGSESVRDVLVNHIHKLNPDWPGLESRHGSQPTFQPH